VKRIMKSISLGAVSGGKLHPKTFFLTSEVVEEMKYMHHLNIVFH
jgi:hypothetical protein